MSFVHIDTFAFDRCFPIEEEEEEELSIGIHIHYMHYVCHIVGEKREREKVKEYVCLCTYIKSAEKSEQSFHSTKHDC